MCKFFTIKFRDLWYDRMSLPFTIILFIKIKHTSELKRQISTPGHLSLNPPVSSVAFSSVRHRIIPPSTGQLITNHAGRNHSDRLRHGSRLRTSLLWPQTRWTSLLSAVFLNFLSGSPLFSFRFLCTGRCQLS